MLRGRPDRPGITRIRALALACLALALALAACGSSGNPSSGGTTVGGTTGGGTPTSISGQSSDLINTKWILVGYRTAGGRTVEPVAGSNASLLFQRPGKVSGSTGCNDFSGTYEALNRTLTINLGPITTKACSGELGTQQDAVLDNLSKVALFSAEGGRLVLADGSKTTLLTYDAG